MEDISFRAMGSGILAALDRDGLAAREALARVPEWFAEWEGRLTRFRPESELMRLNAAGGGAVSLVLWDVLSAAIHAARESRGLVVPTTLAALVAAGYGRSFEELVDVPQPANDCAHPQDADAWRSVELRPRERSVRLPPAVRLDLGGIAKGWAADRAAARLARHGPALVDAGGDIAVSGRRADGSPWPIGVADPRCEEGDLALLCLARGGVATSGRDYRRWSSGGEWRHHIIDPRTGRPAETDVLSATVVAPSARAAEVAAKVTLILGSQAGLAWIDARPALAGLVVTDEGRLLRSRRMAQHLW